MKQTLPLNTEAKIVWWNLDSLKPPRKTKMIGLNLEIEGKINSVQLRRLT